jgi:hypothetical protein
MVLASSGSSQAPQERLIREPPQAYAPCPAAPGSIRRDQLQRILDRGPGVFLYGIEVEMVPWGSLSPSARGAWGGSGRSRFGGWRILRFHPGDPCLGRAGLERGDVVRSVNGRVLRRPEDLLALWATLAPRLVIRLYRGGEPLVFVVPVLSGEDSSKKREAPRPP